MQQTQFPASEITQGLASARSYQDRLKQEAASAVQPRVSFSDVLKANKEKSASSEQNPTQQISSTQSLSEQFKAAAFKSNSLQFQNTSAGFFDFSGADNSQSDFLNGDHLDNSLLEDFEASRPDQGLSETDNRETDDASRQSDEDRSLEAENDDLAAAETRETPSDNVEQGTVANAQQGSTDTEATTATQSQDAARSTRPLESGPVTKAANQTETQQTSAQQTQTVNPNSQVNNGSSAVKVQVQQSTTGLVDQSLTQQIQSTQDTRASAESAAREGRTLQQSSSQALNSIGKGASATANTGQAIQQTGAFNSGNNQQFNSNSGQNNNGKLNVAAAQAGNAGAASTTGANAPGSFASTLAATGNAKAGTANPLGKQEPATRVTVADQVSVNIKKGAEAGADRITVKLNPLELGRVEIKLETNDQGLTRALVVAERPETLDLLQRDARALEKALQESGLKTDGGSLNFSLQQDNQQTADRGQDGGTGNAANGSEVFGEENDLTETAVASARGPSHDGDLDISI
ncbi:flagellar hook-length control protein FliK [Kiloniella sp. b19]|uniref:flagellar hook-length control protein FliK n=1 Tax=Kiloniella sp. GXU_MW_B19 TaxID=3141326 RepID=UPI0031E41896